MKIKQRERYTRKFREKAVQKSIDSSETVGAVAAKLGVNRTTLTSWRSKMAKEPKARVHNTGPHKSLRGLESENRRLKKKLQRAELENEVLKKANEYFDKLPR